MRAVGSDLLLYAKRGVSNKWQTEKTHFRLGRDSRNWSNCHSAALGYGGLRPVICTCLRLLELWPWVLAIFFCSIGSCFVTIQLSGHSTVSIRRSDKWLKLPFDWVIFSKATMTSRVLLVLYNIFWGDPKSVMMVTRPPETGGWFSAIAALIIISFDCTIYYADHTQLI